MTLASVTALAQTPPGVLIVGQIAEPKSLDPAVGKPIQTHEAALSDVQVSPTELPGCSFAPRCAYASDLCHGEPPALEAATPHAAACFHPLG